MPIVNVKVKLMHKLIVPASLVFFTSILSAQTPEQIEFFEKIIRPILAGSCSACHNAKATTVGLDLSTTLGIRHAVHFGGGAGKVIPLRNILRGRRFTTAMTV